MTDKPVSTRRDFLQGKASLDAAKQWLNRPAESPPPSATRSDLLVQISRAAMATEFQVILNAHQDPAGPEAALEALDRIEELEDQLSVYREHSEVSRLNRQAAGGPVAVDWGLYELLRLAVGLWRDTGGAFDITAGPLSRAWGFHRRRGQWPPAERLREAMACVGSDGIGLDDGQRTVQFLRPDVEINLGAIGKGWALDEAAQCMELQELQHFLLQGGQSSLLARGSRHGCRGWSVGLTHPLIPQQRLAEVDLCDAAIGTSGCGNQFFYHQGRRLGHILDPRSGYPAEGVLSATVVAPTAAEADALATALYVMGPAAAEAFLSQRDDLSALLVLPGAKSGAVALLPLGRDPDQWRRSEAIP